MSTSGYIIRSLIENPIINTSAKGVDSYSFSYVKTETMIFDNNFHLITSFAFLSCETVKYIDLSKTQLKTLPIGAFQGCYSLKTLLLPNITSMDTAFAATNSIRYLYLPPTLTSITNAPFLSCRNLKYIFYAGKTDFSTTNFFKQMNDVKIIVTVDYPTDLFSNIQVFRKVNSYDIVYQLFLSPVTCYSSRAHFYSIIGGLVFLRE